MSDTTSADETENEAALKMQRAYRRHLARTRAARKCVGMNKETLEWARSYKGSFLARIRNCADKIKVN